MTREEAKKALLARPERMRTRRWLWSEVRHETHEGVHTYHPCPCGRRRCRSDYCILCLQEMLDLVM